MRSLRLLLATLLCATGLVLAPNPVLGDPAAHAAEPVPLVSIALTAIEPSLPKRDGTVTLSGTVTNLTAKPLSRLRAVFWRNQAPIADKESLDQALTSPANVPIGSRVDNVKSPKAFQDLYTDADHYLDPAKSAPFTITARVADLTLSPSDGVYLMGVHVLQNDVLTAVGRARVFVPVLDASPKNTLQLTSVVMLTSQPSLVRTGLFFDDHLAEEVKPSGRLRALLVAAQRKDMTFAVDPSMIAELKTMKDGYQVLSSNGSTVAGTGANDATAWLDQFSELIKNQDGYRLPYGSPDVASLAHTGRTDLLERTITAGKTVAETASLPLLVMPAAGQADADTMRAATTFDPSAILLSDASADGSGPLLQGQGSAPIVSFTSTTFGGGPGPDPRETAVHLQQRMLADTWIEATTSEPGATLGRVQVITDATEAAGEDESLKVPWTRRATLTDLLQSAPTAWDQKLRYTDAMTASELPADQLDTVDDLRRSYATYAELLVDNASAVAAGNAAVARGVSGGWRGHPDEATAFLAPQSDHLRSILRDGVKLSATPKVTTTGARSGFPITILNQLGSGPDDDANAIRVGIQFTSINSQRVSIDPIAPDTQTRGDRPINSQTGYQAEAKVNATTNGVVQVRAQMVTESGARIGRPIDIEVNATRAGAVGWFIAIGAGIVLIGATALRIRQVAKERAADGGDASVVLTDTPDVPVPPVTPPAQDLGVKDAEVRDPHVKDSHTQITGTRDPDTGMSDDD